MCAMTSPLAPARLWGAIKKGAKGAKENRMKGKALVGAFGAFLIALGLSASAHAMSPDVPGQVLWTYYETTETFTNCDSTTADTDGCNVGGGGDNIIRLIN